MDSQPKYPCFLLFFIAGATLGTNGLLKRGERPAILNLILWQNFFGLLAKFYRQSCQKCILHFWHRNFLRRRTFFIKLFFQIFRERSKNLFAFLSENFRHGCQNCILRVHRNYSRKNSLFSEKKFIFSSFWDIERNFFTLMEKIFRVLANFFRQGCQNCLVVVLKNSCRESFFLFPDIER